MKRVQAEERVERRFTLTLELNEKDAVELATIVANLARCNVAYEMCGAFEKLGVDWDNDLIDFKENGDRGIFFKA